MFPDALAFEIQLMRLFQGRVAIGIFWLVQNLELLCRPTAATCFQSIVHAGGCAHRRLTASADSVCRVNTGIGSSSTNPETRSRLPRTQPRLALRPRPTGPHDRRTYRRKDEPSSSHALVHARDALRLCTRPLPPGRTGIHTRYPRHATRLQLTSRGAREMMTLLDTLWSAPGRFAG